MIDLKPACHQMIVLLTTVTDDQLANATPCTEYTLNDLIKHVDEASQGFAALAPKNVQRTTTTDTPELASRERVAQNVRNLSEVWDSPEAWQGSTEAAGVELSNEVWGKIALTEIVVHGWDIAQTTGQSIDLPEDTLRACLDHVTEFVPNAPIPEGWGSAVDVPANAPLLDRIVAITGRTP